MNTRFKRMTALVLTAGVLVSALSLGAGAAEQDPSVTKEETVYVIADASGASQEVIVSDWLQNHSKKDSIPDTSDLTDIQVVQGDAVRSGSGEQFTWDCGGEDVYYQGTTDRDLPVGVTLRYQLDGKSIAPQDLAGRSGHLTIQIQYTNNTAQSVTVDGKQEIMYAPFLMATGIILDNSCCQNVQVDHGMVKNDGDRTIILGYGLPGLGDSLKLDSLAVEAEELLEFPDSVEITADVTDFSMEMSLTVASCNLLDQLDLSGSETQEALEEALDSLEDAATELLDGTQALLDGASSLKDGTGALKDGAVQLDDGVAALQTGGSQLNSGAAQLQAGADSLDQGIQSLNSGILQIQTALETLDSQSSSLTGGSAALKSALVQMQSALGSVSGSAQEIGTLVEASNQMQTGIDALVENVSALQQSVSYAGYKSTMAQNGLDVEQLRESNTAAIASLQATIDSLNQQIATLQASSSASSAASAPTAAPEEPDAAAPSEEPDVAAEPEPESADETASTETTAPLSNSAHGFRLSLLSNSAVDTQIAQLQAQVSQLSQVVQLLQANNAGIDGTEAYLTGVNANLAALLQGVEDLQSSYTQFNAGIAALAGKLGGLMSSVSSLTEGVNVLVEGAAALDNGTQAYTAGVSGILAGHRQIVAGSSALVQGSSALKSGSAELSSGAISMQTGIASLREGSTALKDGAVELDDGAGELLDGAQALQEGMAQFKAEGIDQLVSLYRDNIPALVHRLEALQNLGWDYQSFSGLADGAAGSVTFLFRTDSITQ